MSDSKEHLKDLHDIKQIMERSSRFNSLSGWSGIMAGLYALVGVYFGRNALKETYYFSISTSNQNDYTYFPFFLRQLLHDRLFYIAIITFIAALVTAIVFTYIRSRKNNTPVWSRISQRLLVNFFIPMVVGFIFILKLLENGNYGLIAPACLIFYGNALINSGKYTLSEVKYLGYCEVFLGIVNCWFTQSGLYFWAVGFGVLHIIYGVLMLIKYERSEM